MTTTTKLETSPPALFAVDWGTSSCRIWMLDGTGRVLDQRKTGWGILQTAQIDADRDVAFSRTLRHIAADLLDAHPCVPVLCCGMVGSNHGWREAPYLPVPTDTRITGDSLTAVPFDGHPVYIIPGLRQSATAEQPFPNVMRGEETQIIGALAALDDSGSFPERFVMALPGTHTKWVDIQKRTILSFSTALTGDLYASLLRDSILAVSAQRNDAGPDPSFLQGMRMRDDNVDAAGITGLLFSTRTLAMSSYFTPAQAGDYLSGLLIGDEVAHLAPKDGRPIVLVGSHAITSRYRIALEHYGHATITLGEETTVRGLWSIAVSSRIITTSNRQGVHHEHREPINA